MYECMNVCMYACMYVYVCMTNVCMHVCMYIRIYINLKLSALPCPSRPFQSHHRLHRLIRATTKR
jgi:hypothetical protein